MTLEKETRRLFGIIFQEAHVVDFDFSMWDQYVRLVISAGLFGANFEGRGPLHNVDFVGVKELHWKANHLDLTLDSPEQHCQWVIMEFQVDAEDSFNRIKLSGFGPTPTLEVVCASIRITELDPSVVDRVNPTWNQPSRPLARPGFEGLLSRKPPSSSHR